MVISVLERRGEIGLRRALGATKRHISTQFLMESALLASLGGFAGLIFGAIATLVYAIAQGQPMVVPAYVLVAAPAAGVAIGGNACDRRSGPAPPQRGRLAGHAGERQRARERNRGLVDHHHRVGAVG